MIRNLVSQLGRALNLGSVESSPVDACHDTHPQKLQEEVIAFYSQFVHAGDLCFDVGANIGNKAKVLLELGARVICIEPQPNCIDVLKDKYQNNPNVVILPKGLATHSGNGSLSICGSADTISTFSEKWKSGRFSDHKWESAVDVPVTTLDMVIEEFGSPKFCKIDVEGFEYEVLRGLSTPIPFIAFEFTREFIDDARHCVDYLSSLGYVDFNYALGETPSLVLYNWTDGKSVLKSMEQNPGELLWGDIYARFHS